MKKITLLMLGIAYFATTASAQNLITNPSFESDIATFTVVEGTTNVLMRVNGIQDANTQTANPTATATAVQAGLWVKKAPNTGYIKHIVTENDKNSGARSVNLKINAGYSSTGLASWFNSIAMQKIDGGLSNTKKYKASVWAKVDDNASNAASVIVLFVTDNTSKVNITKTITLTGGTTWTKYDTMFDIPTHISNNSTANFATAFFGLGITTTYTDGKTNYAGVLVDDFVLEEDNTTTSVSNSSVNNNAYSFENNQLTVHQAGLISIYTITGAKVKLVNAQKSQNIALEKGAYIIQFENNELQYTKRVFVL